MNKKPIIIRQYMRWLILELVLIFGGLIIVIGELLDTIFQWGITENTDFGLYSSTTIAISLPILLVVMHKILKNKGTVEITEEYAYAKYPNRIEKGFVVFSDTVYYSYFNSIEGTEYIIISNEPFDLNVAQIEREIDYAKQIPIKNTKKVKATIPKTGWKPGCLRTY